MRAVNGEVEVRLTARRRLLVVLTQAPVAPEPGEGALDHPAPLLRREAAQAGGPFHDVERVAEVLPGPRQQVGVQAAVVRPDARQSGEARRRPTAGDALVPSPHRHVLVLVEVGYLTHASDAANVLYRVVNECYMRGKPMMVTTNKPLASRGHVLHDDDLAEAILDRLLERGTHFEMRGRSYRTRRPKEPLTENNGQLAEAELQLP